jgi:hypothetical protein
MSISAPQAIASKKLFMKNIANKIMSADTYGGKTNTERTISRFIKILDILFFIIQ